jgi:hypothetical protein
MKRSVLKFATLPILAGVLTLGGHGQAGPPRTVEATGCVWEGVEAGCLMVTDKDTDDLYNILISSGEKPQVGTGIFFMGTVHQGATACMQGQPVEVKNWVKRKLNCSQAPQRKKPNPY